MKKKTFSGQSIFTNKLQKKQKKTIYKKEISEWNIKKKKKCKVWHKETLKLILLQVYTISYSLKLIWQEEENSGKIMKFYSNWLTS